MQWVINGVADGAIVAVLALALMLVYSTTGIFYVALGAVYSLPPFVAMTLLRQSVPWPLALLAGTCAAALLSAGIEAANHWPLERRKSSSAAHVVTSLGINIVIVQLLVLGWGNELQVFGVGPRVPVNILGASVPLPQFVALIAAGAVFTTVATWMWRARSAAPLRALAVNPEELALTGTNVRALRLTVFALAGALASIASYVRAFDSGFDTGGGLGALVLAFSALVIGGRDTVWGALLGGLLLGVLRAAVAWFEDARLQEPMTFFVFALFLLFWPTGLLGRRVRLEAEP